jgi:hypothetical protein
MTLQHRIVADLPQALTGSLYTRMSAPLSRSNQVEVAIVRRGIAYRRAADVKSQSAVATTTIFALADDCCF